MEFGGYLERKWYEAVVDVDPVRIRETTVLAKELSESDDRLGSLIDSALRFLDAEAEPYERAAAERSKPD